MSKFVSEDDIKTFEGWLSGAQGLDPASLPPEQLAQWRQLFEELTSNPTPKVQMDLGPVPTRQRRYGVAVREGSDLWLTLWVRRSAKGDIYVMVPRGDRKWDPHTSYHHDGTFHAKSYDKKLGKSQTRQALTSAFQGSENVGAYHGHGPKTVGAICDPAAFSDVLEVAPGVLGPRNGCVVLDLLEPGCDPISWPGEMVQQKVFDDAEPWLVARIFR